MTKTLKDLQEDVERRYFAKRDLTYLACCLAGEAGEACNIIKKIGRDGKVLACEGLTREDLFVKLALEIPDVIFYALKIASECGWDVENLWKEKMKVNDEKYGRKVF